MHKLLKLEEIFEDDDFEEDDFQEDIGCIEIRDKEDWEENISEFAPAKRTEEQRVSMFKKLKNGLTPYEIMYGKQDDDFAYNSY